MAESKLRVFLGTLSNTFLRDCGQMIQEYDQEREGIFDLRNKVSM